MQPSFQSSWVSPVGRLRIVVSDACSGDPHCMGLYFPDHRPEPKFWSDDVAEQDWRRNDFTQRVVAQLAAYFADGNFRLDLPSRLHGTEFQQQVWQQLTLIPVGTTRSYQEIAELVGRPAAARAVGSAIARNPLSIIVPCHRVIGSCGGLAGFAGGRERKEFLLHHESAIQFDNRTSQSVNVTTPDPTTAQPNTVSVRVPGSRPVQVTRAATTATTNASNAKHQPPTFA